MNEADYIAPTRRWVEQAVIGLNLCPFAKREWVRDRVRIVVTHDTEEWALLATLHAELDFLEANPAVETTLIVHPDLLTDFFDYNQFLGDADALLNGLDLEGIYQIASFHPDYQFGGTDPDDAENYTNRSPFPMLHLLREASLEGAIARYPDVDSIPDNNMNLMNDKGADYMRALLAGCFKDDEIA